MRGIFPWQRGFFFLRSINLTNFQLTTHSKLVTTKMTIVACLAALLNFNSFTPKSDQLVIISPPDSPTAYSDGRWIYNKKIATSLTDLSFKGWENVLFEPEEHLPVLEERIIWTREGIRSWGSPASLRKHVQYGAVGLYFVLHMQKLIDVHTNWVVFLVIGLQVRGWMIQIHHECHVAIATFEVQIKHKLVHQHISMIVALLHPKFPRIPFSESIKLQIGDTSRVPKK